MQEKNDETVKDNLNVEANLPMVLEKFPDYEPPD
jgi:hypothetical protein